MDRYAETVALLSCRAVSLRADRQAPPPFEEGASHPFGERAAAAGGGGGGGGNRSRSMAASAPTLPIRKRGIDILEQSSGGGGQPRS